MMVIMGLTNSLCLHCYDGLLESSEISGNLRFVCSLYLSDQIQFTVQPECVIFYSFGAKLESLGFVLAEE